jgi:cobalt/nickel transport system permease protein
MDNVALHIANGVLDGPVSIAYAVIVALALAYCVYRGRQDLDDRLAPMAGLVAAFIFAVQMLNFPVLPGISGHLLGGALAALLVGPWVGALCVSVVLIIQALVFADGGVTALGPNIFNMALVGTAVAYGLIVVLLRILPRTPRGLGATAFIASVVAVVAAALSFVVQYALGGTADLITNSLGYVTGVMAGTHVLIGIGEGVIAAVTVMTVAKTRPDLVYALRRRPVRVASTAGGVR